MGTSCTSLHSGDSRNDEKGEAGLAWTPPKLVKKHHSNPAGPLTDDAHSTDQPTQDLVQPLDALIDPKLGDAAARITTLEADRAASAFRGQRDYFSQRAEIQKREACLAFDWRCTQAAPDKERDANDIIQILRQRDNQIFANAGHTTGYGGQRHPRFAGDHFLYNAPLIGKTALFNVARKMPKGAHLHIHFNANLLPHVLLDIAKKMNRMFITSDLPLVGDGDFINYDRCEIQFSILDDKRESQEPGLGSLFTKSYQPRQKMKFQDFLAEFPEHYKLASADQWLVNKLVFHEEEAHGWLQTAEGAWEKFNGRTRMMKGLFNYETAYRTYTRQCLQEFVDDNIQYAEIRPNFMPTNQLWTDDGTALIDNEGIMKIIINECEEFQRTNHKRFGGIKIIYCTPRSFKNEQVRMSLEECIRFKKTYPDWIAGFDLVGEESKGFPLKQFIPEFLSFKEKCAEENLDIPFLFHCGETLEIGGDTDGNLVDALLLNSKRIGHGFALARHPYIMEHMKKRGICLEVCPISNEILGLTPRMNGHTMYSLLANNVHCTVNSDNGTLFKSTLSHDFYQVMVGKNDMTLHGWRQLIEWSLQHSCLSPEEFHSVRRMWEAQWEDFLDWVKQEYGGVTADGTPKR